MGMSYVPPAMVPAKAYGKLPPRVQIEAAIETLIGILDAADPDTDFEEVGAEDSFVASDGDGPGCPITDPPEEDDHSGDPLDQGEGTLGLDC